MTKRLAKRESSVMMSSVIPSEKYSCSGSPDMLLKGRTATEGLSGSSSTGALEVLAATGRPLSDWRRRATPGLARPWLGLTLELPRASLYPRIEARLGGMLAAGAIEEVRAFRDLDLSSDLPAMKAVGLRELMRHVAGEVSLEEATRAAEQASRRYAKRQLTWQRNKMRSWNHLLAQDSECFFDKIFPIVSRFLLTPPE